MTPAEPTHVLIVTDDVLTERMAGPAIRAWEIAGLLSRRPCGRPGDDVTGLRDAQRALRRPRPPIPARFVELEAWCDVALVQGYVLERVPPCGTRAKS